MYNSSLHKQISQGLKKRKIDIGNSDNMFYTRFIANASSIKFLYFELYNGDPDCDKIFNQLIDTTAKAYINRPTMLKKRDEVKENLNRVAFQRGPLVYCVEGVDHKGSAWNLIVPDQVKFAAEWRPDLLGGVMTLTGTGMAIVPTADGIGAQTIKQKITAVPYFSWCNRGSNQMLVWLPRKVKEVKIP